MSKNFVTITDKNTSLYQIDCSINYELSDVSCDQMFFLDLLKKSYECYEISQNYYHEKSIMVLESIPKIDTEFASFKKFIIKEIMWVSFCHNEKSKKSFKILRDNGSTKVPKDLKLYANELIEFYISTKVFFSKNNSNPNLKEVSKYFKSIENIEVAVDEIHSYFENMRVDIKRSTIADAFYRRKKLKKKFQKIPSYFTKFRFYPEFLINTPEQFSEIFN